MNSIKWTRSISGGRFTFVSTGEGDEWKLSELSVGTYAERCIDRMPFSVGTLFDSTAEALAFLRVSS